MTGRTSFEDEDPEIVSAFDIWVMTLGWLWSFSGLFFTVFCLVGVLTMPRYILKTVFNAPRSVDASSIHRLETNDVVEIRGRINGRETFDFQSRFLKEEYTIAVMDVPDRSVILAFHGVLQPGERTATAEQTFIGTVTISQQGEFKVGKSTVAVSRTFQGKDIPVPERIAVVMVGEKPTFNWLFPIAWVLCLAGVIYVGRTVYRAIYFIRHPDRFIRKLSAQADA